eukprot:m.428394 g.428394  ORF g.428394 m.428394 type:complete len:76 (+) comp20233_c0_seq12:2799-3026(+)
MFEALKLLRPEPDAAVAAKIGDDAQDMDPDEYAPGPHALLRKLPGVTSKNARVIMEKVTDLKVGANVVELLLCRW